MIHNLPQTDRLSNLPTDDRYMLLLDSQMLDAVCQNVGIPPQYWDDITAAYVLVGDGEYLDVWLSESSRPYELGATFHNVRYYTMTESEANHA